MKLKYLAIPTETVRALQAGKPDANGQMPGLTKSDGGGNPCRHCFREIPAGEKMLILAYRPFSLLQPYAEVGPIFLCADPCERHPDTSELPALFTMREEMLIRGYSANDRIVYGTGQVTKTDKIGWVAEELFARADIAYIHMRSSSDNCYHCRIERA